MDNYLEVDSMEKLNEIIDREQLVILYFDTNSWGVGKVILSKLMDLANKDKTKTLLINLDKQLLMRGQYLVFSAPTVLLISKKREILRESKFIDLENVERVLKEFYYVQKS